ncbi:MAG: alkaline phosphatase family protein [Thermoflexaceae bacterium]|nr:alkaline phosphatase family protein [Thermoflexaceae bacterium]
MALTGSFPAGAAAVVLAFYFGFTVVLWGTIYYHLRIGTRWTNGIRFIRLVCENPDPTSGNFLEQAPKVLMLVFAVLYVTGDPGAGSVSLVLGFSGAVAVAGLLLHQWFFTWVPALPQPRIVLEPPVPQPPRSRRVIAIVIDGCRADRLDEARTPVIDRLRAEGTTFTRMSTVYPARTVTCFASMLTGAAPATHGMRSNFVPSLGVKCESVFDVLRRAACPPASSASPISSMPSANAMSAPSRP